MNPLTRSYDRVSGLEVEIDAVRLHGLELRVSADWTRRTTEVHLEGGGLRGRGEDVTYSDREPLAFQARAGELAGALRGRWTLAELSSRLDEVPLFSDPPELEASRNYRRWGLESAALDLALRQAGCSLAEALGGEPRPLRFVASMDLGGPEEMVRVRRILESRPTVDLKLDAVPGWTPEMIAELAASGRVTVIDFKGAYEGTPVDTELDLDLYRRVLAAFPRALLEDPHRRPDCLELLAPHRSRVTWDAPLHSADDIDDLPWRPEVVNVKPSRFGTLESLLDFYDRCRRDGIDLYGGGQFELGIGRDQIQTLASLFHPDAPNDVAPREYNEDADPADLPDSPLPPPTTRPGFAAYVA